uniref:Ascorbate-specific PTS system EIIA component n=2 Tax=Faecalibaculum rodentium TaxID=1702221 RepID=A0A140DYV6_9FIRM|nr:PTS sugar transporter subunit IIB [Faecalibaculum rodentium]
MAMSDKGGEYMLRELTDTKLMKLGIRAIDWQDAIRQAAQPLVDQSRIRESYVEDIIQGVRDYGPYIVLTKNVALPHARPEAGALQDAIGIATLETPVNFGNRDNDPVKYLFCLSATDDEKHLAGLAQLAELLEDRNFLNILDHARTPDEIIAYLDKLDC